MDQRPTIARSVEEEVIRHKKAILNLSETAKKIADKHNCRDDDFIRAALLRRSKSAQILIRL